MQKTKESIYNFIQGLLDWKSYKLVSHDQDHLHSSVYSTLDNLISKNQGKSWEKLLQSKALQIVLLRSNITFYVTLTP